MTIKPSAAEIKGGWIKQNAFCRLFFAKERRKALKGKLDGDLKVYFFTVR